MVHQKQSLLFVAFLEKMDGMRSTTLRPIYFAYVIALSEENRVCKLCFQTRLASSCHPSLYGVPGKC